MQVSELWIYPVKSLRGYRVDSALLERRGLEHDRRMMIVDENGRFISQRSHPRMALIDVSPGLNGWRFALGEDVLDFEVGDQGEPMEVWVWQGPLEGRPISNSADAWLSRILGVPLRLVQMTPEAVSDDENAFHVSFADGFPVLVVGQESLDDLNGRLSKPVDMRRFRPNIVVKGFEPFAEESWGEVQMGSATLRATTRCGRCIMTTIDPDDASGGTEPLRTLATYRNHGQSVDFGMNLITVESGEIRVGDQVTPDI
jgi:uncharacterized protein YcbX